MNNTKSVLLIFTKNPELGKCKTRLASTLGDEKALSIYIELLRHTKGFTEKVATEKHVYYSESIPESDLWTSGNFKKKLQIQGDLGTKMGKAFEDSFKSGHTKVIIIGSDCAEINEEDINRAFKLLDEKEVIIGPAIDGGYYLIGMGQYYPFLFKDKSWSTPKLIDETIDDLKKHNISFELLEEKSDIDYEEDLNRPGYIDFDELK